MRRLNVLALSLFALATVSYAQEPAAPAETSAPAATATATPSTPAVTETPAASSTSSAEVTPSASDSPTQLTQNEGESDAEFLGRVIKQGQETPEEEQQEEAPADPNAEKPAEEQDEQQGAENGDEEPDPYEETPGPLPPKELNAKIAANPALKAALDADPDLKNSMFAASRLAAEASEFKSIFVNPEQAKIAAATSAEYNQLADLVTAIDKPEDAQGFYGKLMELSIIKDDDGNPIIDQKSGKPVSDGTVGRLIHHTGALFLNHFGQEATAKNDDELAAAVEVLRARAFGGSAPTDTEGLTEQQREAQQEIDRQKAALNEQQQSAEKAKRDGFNQRIVTGIDTATATIAGGFLARTDIPEANRGDVQAKIIKETYELIANNPLFQREQDELERRVIGPKTEKARIDLGKKWFNATYLPIARKYVAEAGAKLIARQGKQQQSQAARVEASRSEAPGSLRTSRPIQQNGEERGKAAIASLTEKLGRTPSTSEVFAELLKAS